MKKNENNYATMNGEELGVRLRELQGKLLTLRTQAVTEKVEDPTAIGKARREIARVLTARRAQQLGIKHGGSAAPKAPKPAKAVKPKASKPEAKSPKAGAAAGEKKITKKPTTRTTKKAASK